MSGTSNEAARLIKNEQTKLTANALDRASTAIGISSLFPLWQLSAGSANRRLLFVVSAYGFLFGHFCYTGSHSGSQEAPIMDFPTLFVYFGFPISVVALCYAGVLIHERRRPRD